VSSPWRGQNHRAVQSVGEPEVVGSEDNGFSDKVVYTGSGA
jgi:hypothetical protein